MPVRWTAEMVSAIFVTMLEVQDIRVDYDAIVKGWPSNLEKPSKKALQEQIFKIKKGSKTNPSTPSISRTTSSNSKGASVSRTPASRTRTTKATPSKKRKVANEDIDDDDDEASDAKIKGITGEEAQSLNNEASRLFGSNVLTSNKTGLTIDTTAANKSLGNSAPPTPRSARAASQKASLAIKNEAQSDGMDVESGEDEKRVSSTGGSGDGGSDSEFVDGEDRVIGASLEAGRQAAKSLMDKFTGMESEAESVYEDANMEIEV